MGGFTITPDCFGELICCVDEMFVVHDGKREKLPSCFLVELLDQPLRIESAGVVRCMAARLRAWSVGPLPTDAPDGTPARGWRNAEILFAPWFSRISASIERCDWHPLIDVFDEMLMQEVRRWQPSVMTGIAAAERFVGDRPRPTGRVARDSQITARQVERRVRTLTRTSPKQLACLCSFQRARDAIWANPAIDLVRLAIDAGYADQPHMTQQFRRYAGQTPAQFARRAAEEKNEMAAQDVAFVQEIEKRGD